MTNNKNNTENRYGNLLNKFTNNERNYATESQTKKKEEEMKDRYGNLLDSIERVEDRLYNTVGSIGITNS